MNKEHPMCIADRIKLYIDHSFANLDGVPIRDWRGVMTKIHVDDETRVKANELYLQCRGETILNGKNPATMAAAIVYIAAVLTQCPVTQKQVAESIGIAEVTLRNGYQFLKRKMKL